MNNELNIINNNGVLLVDSRDVADMILKEHKNLIRDIRTYIGYMVATKGEFKVEPSDYFIESSYLNSQNKNQPCYLLTKIGCDMVANKMIGEKGILFTAKYVKKFNQMEKQIQKIVSSFMIEDPIERAKAWIVEQEKAKLLIQEKVDIIEELSPLAELARKRIDKTGTVGIKDATKTFECKQGQITTWAKAKGYIHKSQMDVNELGEKYFKAIGVEYKNIGILEEGLKLIDKNLEEIKTYPCSYKSYLKSKEVN